MNVYEKLRTVQQSLIAPKNQYNSFGKYNYRSCEDILIALKPLLTKVNATVVMSDEVIIVGSHFYIMATAEFIDCESGENVSNKAFARESESKKGMDESQVSGTASSYARKYALNGLFLIDDNKDADTDEYHNQQTAASANVSKSPDEVLVEKAHMQHLAAECSRTGFTMTKLMALYQLQDIKQMTMRQYMEAVARFKKTPSKEAQA